MIFSRKLKSIQLLYLMALVVSFTTLSCDNSDENDIKDEVAKVDEDVQRAAINASQESKAVVNEATRGVYTVTDVDRQPIFGLECPVNDDPVKCSNEQILKFVKDNIEIPKEARRKNQDGFEQVVVVIEKDGSVSDMKYVSSSKKSECAGCQQAAVDVVGKMTGWTPGMKDGEPVAVQMTIPVRFQG